MPKILFLCGSLRAASSSAAFMRALMEAAKGSAEVSTHALGEVPPYNADVTDHPAVKALIEAIGAADGLVIITPEYNYSVPGVLKNAIDWASRPAFQSVFKGKPCLVASASAGALGGVRAQGHLKYILNAMLADLHVGLEIAVAQAPAKVKNGVFEDAATLEFAGKELSAFVARIAARAAA